MKITVVGDIGVDYYKNINLLKPGGIAFNFAYGLVSSGQKQVSLVSILGSDDYSEKLIKIIKKLKINSDYIQVVKGGTPKQDIFLEDGERKFVGYDAGVIKEWKLKKEDISFFKNQDAIFVPLSDGMEKIFNVIKTVKGPIKAVDFSQDYEFADFDKKENIITKNAQFFDIIFVGGSKKHKIIIKKMANKYPGKVFVLTLGKNGSLGFYGNKEYFEPAEKTKTIDTTGAGDAFQSAFLSAYVDGEDIPESLKSATMHASKAIKHIGSTKLDII